MNELEPLTTIMSNERIAESRFHCFLCFAVETARQHRKRDKSFVQEVLLDSIVCSNYFILFICIGYVVSCSSFEREISIEMKYQLALQHPLAAGHERAKRDFNFANRCCHHRRIAIVIGGVRERIYVLKRELRFFLLSSAYPNLLSSFPPVVFSQLGRTGISLSSASRNHR